MTKKALVRQCNDNEVRLAKAILWGVYGEELLGKPLKRNHVPDNPSAHLANITSESWHWNYSCQKYKV